MCAATVNWTLFADIQYVMLNSTIGYTSSCRFRTRLASESSERQISPASHWHLWGQDGPARTPRGEVQRVQASVATWNVSVPDGIAGPGPFRISAFSWRQDLASQVDFAFSGSLFLLGSLLYSRTLFLNSTLARGVN